MDEVGVVVACRQLGYPSVIPLNSLSEYELEALHLEVRLTKSSFEIYPGVVQPQKC